MTNKNKKGFTLTELIVVIVIIAILAAVLIPTYTGIVQKARKSADLQEAKNMNDALTLASVEKGTPKDMEEALSYLYEEGYVLENMNPTASGYNYLWNSKDNTIYYVDKDFNVSYPSTGDKTIDSSNGQSYWLPVAEPSDVTNYKDKGISFCLAKNLTADFTFDKLNDFDTNTFTLTGKISYTGTVSGSVTVDGTITTLEINNANLSVDHYGVVGTVNIIAVAGSSYHEFGNVTTSLTVKEGRAVVETTGYVAEVSVPSDATTTVKVEVAGEVAKLTVNKAPEEIKVSGIVSSLKATVDATVINTGTVQNDSESTVTVTVKATESGEETTLETGHKDGESSLTLSIANLAELKDFRDQVNGGRTYKDITINLTDDIDLTGIAWRPIGMFSRATNKWIGFRGTFNGNNHTITGLSNKGFAVNEETAFLYTNNTTPAAQKEYLYGLFGFVSDGANINSLKLTGVDIDTNLDNYQIVGDSVGALAGYVLGNVTIDNITVSGSVKGGDAVGGIVGRYRFTSTKDGALVAGTNIMNESGAITNSTNNANVTAERDGADEKAGGIIGCADIGGTNNTSRKDVDSILEITGSSNNGVITAIDEDDHYSAMCSELIPFFGANGEILKDGATEYTGADAKTHLVQYSTTLAEKRTITA